MTSFLYDFDSALSDEMRQYGTGVVLGCGIDFRQKKIFCTKDGELLSIFAFHLYLDVTLTIHTFRKQNRIYKHR